MRIPEFAGVVVLVAVAGCLTDEGSEFPVSIRTDGSFDDWSSVPAAVTDPLGDAPPGSPVDLGAVFVRDDPRFVHLLVDLGDTVTVQGMPGTVEIVLDADGDARSGGSYGGVDGADMIVVLSRQRDPMADRHGAGVGVRRIGEDGLGEIEGAGAVGLIVAPTHSSDRFEVRLDRGAVAAGAGEFVAGRLRYVRAGIVGDETPVFRHAMVTAAGADPPLLGADAVARAAGVVRVVTWNVSDGNFRDRPEAFGRVLAALAPDVVLLDEVYAEVTVEELARFGEGIGGEGGDRVGLVAGGGGWAAAHGGGREGT